jgi:hypothetical protein
MGLKLTATASKYVDHHFVLRGAFEPKPVLPPSHPAAALFPSHAPYTRHTVVKAQVVMRLRSGPRAGAVLVCRYVIMARSRRATIDNPYIRYTAPCHNPRWSAARRSPPRTRAGTASGRTSVSAPPRPPTSFMSCTYSRICQGNIVRASPLPLPPPRRALASQPAHSNETRSPPCVTRGGRHPGAALAPDSGGEPTARVTRDGDFEWSIDTPVVPVRLRARPPPVTQSRPVVIPR